MSDHSRVTSFSLTSAVLSGNPLGDPVTREVSVYLPPDYFQSQQRRYPVLYALAPYTGTGPTMVQHKPWSESLDQRMDRLIAGGCPPAIVVMPDCFNRLGGSQYVNSTATGRYEDYFLQEILPAVEQRFRTIPSPAGRGVFGKSSGGYGALRMGMLHQDLFAAVACHSGDMFFEWSYGPDFPRFLNRVQRAGGIVPFVEEFYAARHLGSDEIITMSVLAMAAAYSPDPKVPPMGIDFPFDLETGRPRPEVWARWKDHDPLQMLEQHYAALQQLRLVFVDCGRRDEYNLHFGARQLHARAQQLGVPLTYEEFDDGHRGLDYRYDRSIPSMLAVLDQDSN